MLEVTPVKLAGMGAILHENGVAFRVWAPHADEVSVIGDFNRWNAQANPLTAEGNGYWYGDVPNAQVGQEYRFWLRTPNGETITRIDPYARAVTRSDGNAIIFDTSFDWGDDNFVMPPWNELVIYELHVGSFTEDADIVPGTFEKVLDQIDHFKRMGINAIQIMPVANFPGERSWGYNPSHIFAVANAYGGPNALKRFVKTLHSHGIAVILDVVYNHLGPDHLDLWRFDGWYENDLGGIYFYNDWRALTPWGHTRPDYGREEVRRFIYDNAMMWLDEYRMDGLRFDATAYIRTVNGPGDAPLDEGWTLLQWINHDIAERFPGRILIAEDLQNNEWITKSTYEAGAGFGAQWDAAFVHPVRAAVIEAKDELRSVRAVADAITFKYNNAAFQRVIYSESHDEVANGKARVPHEIDPEDPTGYFAQKRSTLAAAMVFTAPGIPMLFQGQEFLQGKWFRDDAPLDWHQREEFRGIVRLYRDLIALRRNLYGSTKGLTGEHVQVSHVNEESGVLVFQRWAEGGPGDHVLVVVNLTNTAHHDYVIGVPHAGVWKLRLNSDAQRYSPEFTGFGAKDIEACPGEYDGLAYQAQVSIGPYSVLIYSQDAA